MKINEIITESNDPCWDNYKQVGMKEKNGRKVPNCVPKEGVTEVSQQTLQSYRKKATKQKSDALDVADRPDTDDATLVKNMNIASKRKDGIAAANKRLGVAEDWQKTNNQDKTDGMSSKAVKAYRRENPGSKLQTAVTKKPSKLKAGSKDAKRRKSFCARMSGNPGPMKDEKGRPTPKAKALKRWNC